METIYLTVNVIFTKLLHDMCQGQGMTFDNGQYGVLLLSLIIFIIVIIPKTPSV
jgi:hypothetical protein